MTPARSRRLGMMACMLAARTAVGCSIALMTLASLALPTTATAASLPAPVACRHCWRPPLRTSWDWVLSHVPKPPYRAVAMYDIDGTDASRRDVAALHATLRGRRVVCYIDAGTWEPWRPDAKRFPRSILGRRVDGFASERWLDIRPGAAHTMLVSLMLRRLDVCRRKGFDGVELDNVDGYANRTGFRLTAFDQLRYDTLLANAAHRRHLTVLLKNDIAQIPVLLAYFDAALNEQCNQYHECLTSQTGGGYDQFVHVHKAVFQVEYALSVRQFCRLDNHHNFNGVRLDLALDDAVFEPCRSR